MAVTHPEQVPIPQEVLPPPERHPPHPADHHVLRIELLISNILRVGVVVSISLVIVGTVVTFIRHPDYEHSSQAMRRLTDPGAKFPHTLANVIRDLGRLRGRAIVVLGLICLIATPVVRVAISIYAFLLEKDRIFVIVTSIVLILLLLSFFLGKVE